MEKLTFQQLKHLIERTGIGSELDQIKSYMGHSTQPATIASQWMGVDSLWKNQTVLSLIET